MNATILNGTVSQNGTLQPKSPAKGKAGKVRSGASAPEPTYAMTQVEAQPLSTSSPTEKMATATGHVYERSIVNNIGNMQLLVFRLEALPTPYLPVNPLITIASLTDAIAQAYLLVNKVETQKTANKTVTNSRALTFADLPKLATRIINELAACGASAKTLTDARYFVDKLRGSRINKVVVMPGETQYSVSQKSYVNQAQNFFGLLTVVASEPLYDSNTPDLKLPALQAHQEELMDLNKTAQETNALLVASRMQRNHFFNDANTGFVDRALAAKKTVKAMFGAASAEYGSVKGIAFTRIY